MKLNLIKNKTEEQALVLCGHGSRDNNYLRELIEFEEKLKQKLSKIKIFHCFIEINSPGIEECLKSLSNRFTKIFFFPLLLFEGKHMIQDIRKKISNFKGSEKNKIILIEKLSLINDILPNSTPSSFETLKNKREFCLDWIRNYQHNHFFQQLPHELHIELSRNKVLFSDHLPEHFPDAEKVFESISGLNISLFYQALTGIVSHLGNEIKPGKHWMHWSTFLCNINEPYKSHLEKLLSSYLRTPDEYRKDANEWLEKNGYIAK